MSKLSKRRRHRKAAKSNPAPTSNPGLGLDLLEGVLPGFGAYAATRFGVRMATIAANRWRPSLARHAGVAASVAAFGVAWLAAHRVKWLEKYHEALVIGAGAAAIQTTIQTYFPALGWITGDVSASELASNAPAAAKAVTSATPVSDVLFDDPNWYTTSDAWDAGRTPVVGNQPQHAAPPRPPTPRTDQRQSAAVDDLLADLEPGPQDSWAFASEN